MKGLSLPLLALTWLLGAPGALAQGNWERASDDLLEQGQFRRAAEMLRDALNSGERSEAERKQLRFELERIDWTRQDYPLTEEQLFSDLQKRLKDISRGEFELWVRQGRFDSRPIDGERRYMRSSVSNLFFRYPELEPRRVPPRDNAAHANAVYEATTAIREQARVEARPYVLPKRFRVTMVLDVDPKAAPEGETIRAWLPVPRSYPFQGQFALLSTSSPAKHLAPETSPIRSLYLEQKARTPEPTQFRVQYEYTAHGVRFEVAPEKVQPPAGAEVAAFLGEGPHVQFTPAIRALSSEICGSETNPARKARRFYDWIADNIRYSYATEYSTIRNLSEYCLNKGYGDCGQEALLFITLCRLNGIAARWQSGWSTFPGSKTIHDWAEIYLAPYGWIPVDPYMGIWAAQYARGLPADRRRAIRDFYFGGLDQYRIAFNSDHSQDLVPPKSTLRSDNVDFQRGELEVGDRNIYFDLFTYDLTSEELKSPVPHLSQ